MDPDDLFVPVKHTCTYEERRFGTCKCRQNYLRANDNLRSQQRSPLPGNFVWPLRQEERTQLKAELHQRLSALTSGRRILHLRGLALQEGRAGARMLEQKGAPGQVSLGRGGQQHSHFQSAVRGRMERTRRHATALSDVRTESPRSPPGRALFDACQRR